MMKKEIIIINTARESILNESTMLKAFNQDHLFSVNLNVYKKKSNVSKSLCCNDKCVLTSHINLVT